LHHFTPLYFIFQPLLPIFLLKIEKKIKKRGNCAYFPLFVNRYLQYPDYGCNLKTYILNNVINLSEQPIRKDRGKDFDSLSLFFAFYVVRLLLLI